MYKITRKRIIKRNQLRRYFSLLFANFDPLQIFQSWCVKCILQNFQDFLQLWIGQSKGVKCSHFKLIIHSRLITFRMLTKFFHASATFRKKVNRITSLENDVGICISDEHGMCQVAKDYFANLFLENNSIRAPVVEIIEKCVFDDDNVLLTFPF